MGNISASTCICNSKQQDLNSIEYNNNIESDEKTLNFRKLINKRKPSHQEVINIVGNKNGI